MTQQELNNALAELGLKVPEAERRDILNAVKYIDEMKKLVRKPRSLSVEPSYTVSFPRLPHDF